MAEPQAVEARRPKSQPKVVDHLSIHAKMGGGNIVKHHFTSYQHEPMEVHFDENGKRQGKGGGEHIVAHLIKHAGLPAVGGAAPEDEETETEEEAGE